MPEFKKKTYFLFVVYLFGHDLDSFCEIVLYFNKLQFFSLPFFSNLPFTP